MWKSKNTPWAYRKGSTPLHRMPAGAKLVFLFFLSLAAFIPGPEPRSLVILLGLSLILILLSIIAGMCPKELLHGSGPLFLIVLSVFLIRVVGFSPPGFSFAGLFDTLLFCIRIGAAFAAGTLLFSVTTPGEIMKSLSRAETALGIKRLKLGLSLSLMLAFLKYFFEIWEDLNLAWKSRGGKNNLSHLVKLIPLLIEKMMIKAAETALAMEARGV